jgi:voltage-gated potassium channel Kch
MQAHPVRILIPLAVGVSAVICTIFIHALALSATVNFFRHERKLGRSGVRLRTDLGIAVLVILFAFVAHLAEIALWAELFLFCGEFSDFAASYYFSAVNYTTLGYGDVIMSASWKLLGPIEAADGALMFGVSTAIVFAVIQNMLLARFEDLKK